VTTGAPAAVHGSATTAGDPALDRRHISSAFSSPPEERERLGFDRPPDLRQQAGGLRPSREGKAPRSPSRFCSRSSSRCIPSPAARAAAGGVHEPEEKGRVFVFETTDSLQSVVAALRRDGSTSSLRRPAEGLARVESGGDVSYRPAHAGLTGSRFSVTSRRRSDVRCHPDGLRHVEGDRAVRAGLRFLSSRGIPAAAAVSRRSRSADAREIERSARSRAPSDRGIVGSSRAMEEVLRKIAWSLDPDERPDHRESGTGRAGRPGSRLSPGRTSRSCR